MLNISRLETRFQETIFLVTMTLAMSVAVGGVFYLSLSSAGFLSATGELGSQLIQSGFASVGLAYFFSVVFLLHLGHLVLATSHNLGDARRNLPIFLRSSLVYLSLILLIASFLTVLEQYYQWQVGTHLVHGHGGSLGQLIGGFLFRAFGLYGALVILFTTTSVMGISAGYMDIVHSFYVMKDILHELTEKVQTHGPTALRSLADQVQQFAEQKPVFVGPKVTKAPAQARSIPSPLVNANGVQRSTHALSTEAFHLPTRPLRIQEHSAPAPVPDSLEAQVESLAAQVAEVAAEPMPAAEEKVSRTVARTVTAPEDLSSPTKTENLPIEETPITKPLVEIQSWTKRYNKLELSLLQKADKRVRRSDKEMIEVCQMLAERLLSFGIKGEVVAAHQGIRLTMFEFMPAAGMKLSKIQSLSDDLALVLGAESIRILAPIPGKTTVGIEVPNTESGVLRFSEMVPGCLKAKNMELPIPLGLDVYNRAQMSDLSKMPHLLVSGTTGSGKSVFMNSLISGLLFHKSPKELRFLMIDPKMIELSPYNGIPHLLRPVVTDVEEARDLLIWAEGEMDRRYQMFAQMQSKNIMSFNQAIKKSSKRSLEGRLGHKIDWKFEEMPYIVIVIDELADLMLTQRNEVERPITRIAQKARAAGIHMVMATQRPSSDIVTGLIKTNFPTRVSFKVSSGIDSRTILDQPGAERLLGHGDMLFMAQGKPLERLQGSFLSEDEVKKVVQAAMAQGSVKAKK